MIVDCHTHWGGIWEQSNPSDPSAWLAVLDRHQVDRAVLLPTAGLMRLDMCCDDNDTVARVASREPRRLIPFGTAWIQQGQAAVAEARRCIDELGMRGLKFHTWVQGFSTADPTMIDICNLAAEHDVPVLVHDGTPCYALPEQIGGLARQCPGTKFILGHSGLLWNWRSALEAARLPNLWLCLCGPHMRAMEILCARAHPDRLLWGSDFGFGRSDTISYRLGAFSGANVSTELKRKILGENAVQLFG